MPTQQASAYAADSQHEDSHEGSMQQAPLPTQQASAYAEDSQHWIAKVWSNTPPCYEGLVAKVWSNTPPYYEGLAARAGWQRSGLILLHIMRR